MTTIRRNRAIELAWTAHRWLYRLSGGRIGATLGALPVLMLTTKGRKTGELRSVLLTYIADAGRYVVYASHAGEEREPPWWLNLRATREAEVRVDGHLVRVRAREAEGEERARLWERATSAEPNYAEYQKRTTRRIAVVVLEPG